VKGFAPDTPAPPGRVAFDPIALAAPDVALLVGAAEALRGAHYTEKYHWN